MEIHGPGGINGPERPDAQPDRLKGVDPKVSPEQIVDQVQISDQANFLEKLSKVPGIRQERIDEIQRQIDAGEYETPERIEMAVQKLLEEL
jgi:negative regulator of flagellin synthesis FlgM